MKKIVIANSKGGCGKSTLASALADVLNDAQLIDVDMQGSLTQASELTGRHVPVDIIEANGKYLIWDTPPYLSEELPALLSAADLIIIPTRIGDYDLLALGGIVDRVREVNMSDKSYIVFNAVPSRETKSLIKSRGYFFKNYKDIRKSETELNQYEGYKTIATRPIFGHAKKQIIKLIDELKI